MTIKDDKPAKADVTFATFATVGNDFQIFKNLFIFSHLYESEAFHTGTYAEITQQCGRLFYKQKTCVCI